MGLIKSLIVLIVGLTFLGYVNKKNTWVKRFPVIERYKAFLLLVIICGLLFLF